MPRAALQLACLLLTTLVWPAEAHALRLSTTLSWAQEPRAEQARKTITDYTRAAIGKPYRLGAAGEGAYDCSGLVLRAYEAAGHVVPRVSHDQIVAGEPVDLNALRAGDLLFYRFKQGDPERLHVVVYIGDGRAIHASIKHHQVREVDITGSLWANRLVAARTLL